MGVIVDQNSDPSSVDSWALVSGTTVSNMISANLSFIQSIQGSYDYLVDVSVGGQSPVAAGYIYDSGNDTFAAPPPDWISIVRAEYNSLYVSLAQLLSDASNLSSADKATAYADSVADSSGSFTTNEASLADSIAAYIAGGG